jgi:transposase
VARGDVTNAEWALIEPLLPVAATGPLPRRLRDQFNGVMWRFRTGSPWRDVPERYGPWSTVARKFREWALAGVFQSLMDALIAEAAARGQVDLSLVSVDSTVARAHQDAAGMAVSGEVLDALEAAFTEEKGVPLEQQENFRYRVVGTGRVSPTRPARRSRRSASSGAGRGGGERPAPQPPRSGAPRAD